MMATNNQEEKKHNPLLISIICLLGGIVFFSIRKSHDLRLFFLLTIPGNIAIPVLGVFSFLLSVSQFKEWLSLRKERGKNSKK